MSKKFKVLAIALLIALPVFSGTFKGVTMPDKVTIEKTDLVLNGMALRKKLIFKVYVAGLYLEEKEKNADKILKSDGHRRTVMHFLRSVGADKISEAWIEGLEANTPGHSAELKKQFDKLCSWMEAMKDGEQVVFTYIPAKGTQVEVKNKSKGLIEGKAFADALFSCWIGPKPGPGEGFKKALLGITE